jgi:hypothetical protein
MQDIPTAKVRARRTNHQLATTLSHVGFAAKKDIP